VSASYWEELTKWDLIDKLQPLFRGGSYYYDKDSCKIKKHEVLAVNMPWIFARRPEWMNCGLWHQVYFQCLRSVHSQCLNCYKVVVKPQTVKQLFALHELMIDLNLPSKCGIELRDYVKSLYGGYFYCRGPEEGQKRYNGVRGLVSRHVSPEVVVTLKRGCTELEILKGDLSKYELTEDDRKWEEIVSQNVDIPDWNGVQPELIKNHIKRMWIAWAYSKNDQTALEFNDGNDLVTQPVTYHDEKGAQENG
jgi:hypothetical protein